MDFFKQYWILSATFVLVAANDFEAVEKDFVRYFGNKGDPVQWNAARHLYDFKKLVKICDQMKIFRGETAVITDLRVNAGENLMTDQDQEISDSPKQDVDENPVQQATDDVDQGMAENSDQRATENPADQETAVNPDQDMDENAGHVMGDENPDEGTSTNVKQATVKKAGKSVVQNLNLGDSPGVLLFRNQDYKSRQIDVLRCEIANTKHLPTGRRYVYIGRGHQKTSYYLLTKAEMSVNSYFLERLESPTSEPDRKANGPHLASTVWLADE